MERKITVADDKRSATLYVDEIEDVRMDWDLEGGLFHVTISIRAALHQCRLRYKSLEGALKVINTIRDYRREDVSLGDKFRNRDTNNVWLVDKVEKRDEHGEVNVRILEATPDLEYETVTQSELIANAKWARV